MFIEFKKAVQAQFEKLSAGELFTVEVDKDELWNLYLDSFPDGTNNIFRERREYDCQHCKQFVRAAGNVIGIVDNKIVSIWDVEVQGYYQEVADSLSEYIKNKSISNVFLHRERNVSVDYNHQMLNNGETIKWNHFYFYLPKKFAKRDPGPILSDKSSSKEVFKRGLDEISIESAETVIELIDQNSLYRGEENRPAVESFAKLKKEYESIADDLKDNYCWSKSVEVGPQCRTRNTAIGTLLVDISSGMELDKAVSSFESKVAPQNYKRPSTLITKSMIENAQRKVEELGIEQSLNRRYAVAGDLTINNVIFADRSTRKTMNVFDELKSKAPEKIKNLDKVEEITIGKFVENILPKAETIELMPLNKHENNLVSLIAPECESKNIFKWGNNFSWSYRGEVADSMKERVKKAGGSVDGVLRFSIQWNDGDNNQNDFDAHCIEPNGNLIHYPKAGQTQQSSGVLDVDIITPGDKVAVENITWSDKRRMLEGKYTFLVHNYSHKGGKTGFTAEIEYEGKIHSYSYDKELRHGEKVVVAEISLSKKDGMEILKSLPESNASKEIWGINTNTFVNVSMIMNSPNHWNGEKTGNKHWFFILDGCKNDKDSRGFYNEFLNNDLSEHRKVFEVLGSKMKAKYSDDQLSGLGFSSTQRNDVLCRVSGSFSRILKIKF